jgi:hypothetical protein
LARIAVLGGGVFIASAAVSIVELRYAVWGKATTADFRNTVTDTDRYGNPIQTCVNYVFKDDTGQKRRNHDHVALDWKPPANGKLRIEYVSGDFANSRLAGNRNVAMLWIFAGGMTVSIVALVVGTCLTFWKGDPWKGVHGGADW